MAMTCDAPIGSPKPTPVRRDETESSDDSVGPPLSRSGTSGSLPASPTRPAAHIAVPPTKEPATVESRGWIAMSVVLCAMGASHSTIALLLCAAIAFFLRPYRLLENPRKLAPESARTTHTEREAKWKAATEDCPCTGKQYLVVGASGFLGRRVVDLLLSRGETKVRCFDLFPCTARPEWAKDSRVQLMRGDVTKEEDMLRACAGVDCVFSTFAKMSFHERLPHQAASSERVNVTGTVALLAACRAAGVRHVVYTSTSHVMHPGEMLDETAPIVNRDTAHSHYGWTKAKAEHLALSASDDEMKVVAIRPCSAVFGGEDGRLAQRIVQKGLNGAPGIRLGALIEPCSRSDFVYVDNVVLGLLKGEARLRDGTPGVAATAFNVSNEEPMTYHEFLRTLRRWQPGVVIWVMPLALVFTLSHVSEAAQKLSNQLGVRISLGADVDQFSRATVFGVRNHLTVTSAKARQVLNYKPAFTVDDGVQATVAHVNDKEKH